jgi:hypothetical protein
MRVGLPAASVVKSRTKSYMRRLISPWSLLSCRKEDAQDLGQREHELPVRQPQQELLVHVLAAQARLPPVIRSSRNFPGGS